MGLSGVREGGRPQRLVAMVLAVALGAVMVAGCKGGGDGDKGTATPTATATARPHVQPTIDGSAFNFPDRGYAAVIPDGWHANPNSLLAGPQAVDTFFSPDTVEGVQSNISITCEDNPDGTGSDQFVENKLKTIAALGGKDVSAARPVTVGGQQAQELSYTLDRGGTAIVKTDVLFATARCGWTIALASAPSVQPQNAAIFDRFLQTFKLVDGAATPAPGA